MNGTDYGFKLFEYLIANDIKAQIGYKHLDASKLQFDYFLHHGDPALEVNYGVLQVFLIYYADRNTFAVTDDLYYLYRPTEYKYQVNAVDELVSQLVAKIKTQESYQDARE